MGFIGASELELDVCVKSDVDALLFELDEEARFLPRTPVGLFLVLAPGRFGVLTCTNMKPMLEAIQYIDKQC